ncbi:MAG: oxygen-independent coproporphyrinogen III oxidase [Saprospiraceae bacterium]|nr:oxygen-independent coproporphyrinogen III oxidase [Saprospiraceae bacterium]
MTNTTLLSKYDIAAPRYTSYPTVPYWSEPLAKPSDWLLHVQQAFHADRAISLYIHLPFCDSLCTYCGCNKHITKNHAVEHPYIETLLREWKIYRDAMQGRPILRELHLGGGTPTFFSPENLKYLLENILKDVDVAPQHDFGFEAHPWSTSEAHLQTLYDLGFRRVSIGVQDFDEDLMTLVNRRQTIASVERCTELARAIGYESVNYDLIFGLPKQNLTHIRNTAAHVARLRPDRIAFYSYAHVPWIKRSQCAYSEADLPTGAEKRSLYEAGRAWFESEGYVEIGMDHFALPHDALYKALRNKTMHRNFMGYTPYKTRLMIGLGASAIGDSWDAFVQNEKTIADYQRIVNEGNLPIFRSHVLDAADQQMRRHILKLMTCFETKWEAADLQNELLQDALQRLEPLQADGLVNIGAYHLTVTAQGRNFLRNICMAFDARYWQKQPEGRIFSQAV